MTKSNYTQARIAQERTKQIMFICLTLISLFLAAVPFIKLAESTAIQQSQKE